MKIVLYLELSFCFRFFIAIVYVYSQVLEQDMAMTDDVRSISKRDYKIGQIFLFNPEDRKHK